MPSYHPSLEPERDLAHARLDHLAILDEHPETALRQIMVIASTREVDSHHEELIGGLGQADKAELQGERR